MTELNELYWNNRYKDGNTGWDIGYSNPILTNFIKTNADTEKKILIPGCGNAYEAKQLMQSGYSKTYILDVAQTPLERFKNENPNFPSQNILHENFFDHNSTYHFIMEQTFFCALNPSLREDYVKKMHELLMPNGILFGLLFASEFEKAGPPFGGSAEEYETLFTPYFEIIHLEFCLESIPPRSGNELFFVFKKLSKSTE